MTLFWHRPHCFSHVLISTHICMRKTERFVSNPQSWTKVVETNENYQRFYPRCKFSSLPLFKVAPPPPPPFSMLETNKHPRSVLQHGFGGEGVTTDEKGVFIEIQNSIVSWKALVL